MRKTLKIQNYHDCRTISPKEYSIEFLVDALSENLEYSMIFIGKKSKTIIVHQFSYDS